MQLDDFLVDLEGMRKPARNPTSAGTRCIAARTRLSAPCFTSDATCPVVALQTCLNLTRTHTARSSGELQVEARMSGPIAFSIRKLHASPTRAASAVGVRPDSPETERLEKFYGNQLKICISFVLRFPQARRA
jgi:hypothetical protein